jgi:tetratricopeptide (TPR) repeat protein
MDEEKMIQDWAKRTLLGEAEIRESFSKNRLFKKKRASEGRHLESTAGDDIGLLQQAYHAYTEAMLSDDQQRILERILELDPNNADAIYYHTKSLEVKFFLEGTLKENGEMLVAQYSKLFGFAQYIDEADKSLGFLLYNMGELERAIPHLRRSILIDPSQRNMLAHSLYDTGRLKEAYELFLLNDYQDFTLENLVRYAQLLDMFGKTRKARKIRFYVDETNLGKEIAEGSIEIPSILLKRGYLGEYEDEVLRTLYRPGAQAKRDYSEVLAALNWKLRIFGPPKTFTIDEIKEIEERALSQLGVTADEYQRTVQEYYQMTLPRKGEFERRRKQLLHEKYPDLLESHPDDDD